MKKFHVKITELGEQWGTLIDHEYQHNSLFQTTFDKFLNFCQTTINAHLSRAAIEEMLVQQLLTERIFTTLFPHSTVVKNNVIARELRQVINVLRSSSGNAKDLIKQREPFDRVLLAATPNNDGDRQTLLNAVYEHFFQSFAMKVADKQGIVYTPQPIVNFMVKSVQDILQRDFGRSLADQGVQILDPFVGTGNFMIRLLTEIYALQPQQLRSKYLHELHCQEVMLLPYYLASLNIEQEFYELSGQYLPYPGLRLRDTFERVEETQEDMFVTTLKTQQTQTSTAPPILIIIGNPPYNIGQQRENDNNKNRQYPALNKWVADSYAKDSSATNKNALSDVYVKAFRWATWRLREKEKGIVAFVSNNSFIDGIAFDGMRKHLATDFEQIYCLDLGGNIRKTPGVQNVFDIKVGVSINFLIKRPGLEKGIFYAHVGDSLKKSEKLDYLANHHFTTVAWQPITPDENHTWLTSGLHTDFEQFLPLGTKDGKAASGEVEGVIFKIYSRGAETTRDAWAYNFDKEALSEHICRLIETYNAEVDRWQNRLLKNVNLDDFVLSDERRIKWSSRLKEHLARGQQAVFATDKIRHSLYRPFTVQYLYFDEILTHRQGQLPLIFPTPATEIENRVICVNGIGGNKPLTPLMVNSLPDLGLIEATQCFPFYIYPKKGGTPQENLTDWALHHFQTHYQAPHLTKWDIFYYVYGLLHHPTYRDRYAVNLKRELPRIPLWKDFWMISEAGKRLAELHVHYPQQPEYSLQKIATPGVPLHYRVNKMRLTQTKESILYNDALTLTDIPPAVFTYRIGHRSALEWVIDQYQVKIAKGSGIRNDPNRQADEQAIVRLLGQVITVSLETVKIVNELSRVIV